MALNPSGPHYGKINRPPKDESWGWLTAQMLESWAFRSLTFPAMRILLRIWLEHMHHAGQENGNLPCTYDDFEAYGLRRNTIREAIDLLVAMGWIDIAEPGVAGRGIGRAPTRYRLTWLPEPDGARASNRWKNIKDAADATSAMKRAAAGRSRRAGPRTRTPARADP